MARMNGKRVTETSEYVAMMHRVIATWGDRIARDPEALVHLEGLIIALREATDRGMAQAAERGYPQRYMARMLGTSQPAVAKRIAIGRRVLRRQVRLLAVRGERARGLRLAVVPDQHGTEKERSA